MCDESAPDIEYRTYWEIEAPFLLDYVRFGAQLRLGVHCIGLREAFPVDSLGATQTFLHLLRDPMAATEDLAAVLLALRRRYSTDASCGFQHRHRTDATPVSFTLLNYAPGPEACVATQIRDLDVGSMVVAFGLQAVRDLDLTGLMPTADAEAWFGDLWGLLKSAAEHQDGRRHAYNRLKHFPSVVTTGRRFRRDWPDVPTILYRNPVKAERSQHPIVAFQLAYDDEEYGRMRTALNDTTHAIRLMLGAYAVINYRKETESLGYGPAEKLLAEVEEQHSLIRRL